MNKRYLIGVATCAVAMVCSLGSCKDNSKTAEVPKVQTADGKEVAMPIAYVRMDSVLKQYTYSKEIQAKLETDAAASRSRLQGKAAAFQKAAEDFDRRARINAFVSEDAAKKEQARIMRMQQEAAGLEQQLSGELAQKSALMQEDLMKKIEEELKAFNGGRFKLILSNAVVLYGDDALDITTDFVKYLNENYKPADSKQEQAKETKK